MEVRDRTEGPSSEEPTLNDSRCSYMRLNNVVAALIFCTALALLWGTIGLELIRGCC